MMSFLHGTRIRSTTVAAKSSMRFWEDGKHDHQCSFIYRLCPRDWRGHRQSLRVASGRVVRSLLEAVGYHPVSVPLCQEPSQEKRALTVRLFMTHDTVKPRPECQQCGAATSPLYSFLDPTSGRTFRSYKCACGARTLLAVTHAEVADSERRLL